MNFDFYSPTRVHFGNGKLELIGQRVKTYGKRCFLVTTENVAPMKELFDRVKDILRQEGIEIYHFDKVLANPPKEVIEDGITAFNDFEGQVVLAVGGGSSIDTAKSIALLNKCIPLNWSHLFSTYSSPFEKYDSLTSNKTPLISVPTTSGTGSEVTQAAVITDGDDKNSIYHPDNYSKEAILDPELLLTLPVSLTASTGFDAFTHAFESYISDFSSEISRMYAFRAMKLIVEYLPKVLIEPHNILYRQKMMFAQWSAGVSLANAGAHAPHPLSEILGGLTHISHGESLALVYPEFVNETYSRYSLRMDDVAAIFEKPIEDGIRCFLKEIGLYRSWQEYEIKEATYKKVYESPILNYLPFGSKDSLQRIYENAYKRKM
ncbi:iron-containing alcohol dehydrogenase [Acidaminobacter sp. JC074]|uniref:iron-containing alcohol dehydrogenase n=1 Tax=Acidaminobacter sp. JC074 TaxID=2530199 RepID=UPI001F0CEF64|nr:iron-containing alcohol dehydrogenase [Acidaminobacter sp. JC074]MCH4886356.1 iron-containing alcohol dehydrogenase [Acidaminobacter sp. JC074]